MKKKQKKYLMIGMILLLLVIVLHFGNLLPFSTTGSYECSGGQVLSISDAKIYTSSELGGKKVIRVTFSTLPSSECLYIRLTPSSINDELSSSDREEFEATNTILGSISLEKEQKVYNINERSSEKFRNFIYYISDRDIFFACTDSRCKDKFGSSNFINSPTTSSSSTICGPEDCCCTYDNEKGINGEFSVSESFLWESKINIGNAGIITLNQGKLSDKLGDTAFVKWSGNLVSNDNLGSITNRQAYKPYSDNQWRMTDVVWQDLNNKYNTYRTNLINCQDWTGAGDCTDEMNIILGYNSEFNSKTTNKLNDWVSGNYIVKDANIISNKLYVDLKSAVVYPTFTLDIDAEEVGIFISSGEPDVTCPIVSETLVSGQTKDVTASIKNIGSDSGSFTYSVDCNKGSQYLQPSPPQQINSGNTLNVGVRLGLTVEGGIDTASCTFTAQDINSLESDSCTFTYKAEHQGQCMEGDKSCEIGNTQLWTCLSDGSYKKENCPYGCTYESGEYKCDDSSGGGTEPCSSCWNWLKDKLGMEQDCTTGFIDSIKNALFCPFYFLKLAIVLVSSIFGLLLGQQFVEKNFKKVPGPVTWILGLLFAGLVGFLGYTFLEWYFVIPLLIIVVVGSMILNVIPGKKYLRRK